MEQDAEPFCFYLIVFFELAACAVQILLIFLQKMDLLLTKTPAEDIKNSVLPMVYRALEAPSVQIQVWGRYSGCLSSSLFTFFTLLKELLYNIYV